MNTQSPKAPYKTPSTKILYHLLTFHKHFYPLSLLHARGLFHITFYFYFIFILFYFIFILFSFYFHFIFIFNIILIIIELERAVVSEVAPSILPLTFMLTLYPYTFLPLHTLPSFVPADHEIAHQWSGNPQSWDSIYQHQRKPQRLLVKLLTNKSNTTERKTFFSFFLVVTGIKGLSLSFFPCSFHNIVLSTLWCIYSRVESGCKCCPFTCCCVRFRCLRDRVRHELYVVVAVLFIEAPVLNKPNS